MAFDGGRQVLLQFGCLLYKHLPRSMHVGVKVKAGGSRLEASPGSSLVKNPGCPFRGPELVLSTHMAVHNCFLL